MLIAHFADLQLGFNIFDGSYSPTRESDFYRAWLTACQEAVDRWADLVLIAGDIFENNGSRRSPITPESNLMFLRGLDLLSRNGIQVVAVSGNHETPKVSNQTHPLSMFDGLWESTDRPPPIMVTDSPQTLHLEGITIRAIPWIHEQPLTDEDFEPADICLLHAPCPGVDSNYGGTREFNPDWAERYRMVLLGDWHDGEQLWPGVLYSGALERTSFGQESNRTGGWFFKLEDVIQDPERVEYWDSPSREMATLEIGSENFQDGLERVLELSDEYGGTILRLVLDGVDPTEVDPGLLRQLHDAYEFLKVQWKNPQPGKAPDRHTSATIQEDWKKYSESYELKDPIHEAGLQALKQAGAI